VKVKILNSNATTDGKKLFIASLRPIQLKIEDILAFKDRIDNVEHNIEVSDEEIDPVL
jgi:hypothetical protein